MIPRRPVTQAIETLLLSETGRPGDRGEAPGPEDVSPEVPYWVLYAVPGGERRTGGLSLPESGGVWRYQVTSVGASVDQAEWMSDRVRTVLLSRGPGGAWVHPLAGDGWVIWDRGEDLDGGQLTQEGRLWNVHDTLWVAVQSR